MNNSLLIKRLNRARPPSTYNCYGLVCRFSFSNKITGKNSACTTKPGNTMNCYRHISPQVKVDHGKSLLNLPQGRSCKVNNGYMLSQNTNFPEKLPRKRLLGKID